MKQIKTLLIAATLFIGATTLTNAQTKVAHINTGELIKAMPETITAQADIQKIGETYKADIEAMKLDLKTKVDRYNLEARSKTDEENEKRKKEVLGDEQALQEYAYNADQTLQKKETEYLKPITEKAQAAILKVAKAQGFDYVLNSAQGGGVLMAEGKNLLEDVKKELGIK